MLVTLQQARDHLRSDTSADDDYVTQLIASASSRVLAYIDAAISRFQNADGTFTIVDGLGNWIAPDDVKHATLLLVGYLYNQRDQDTAQEFGPDGELPRPVRALLRTYRKPVLS